MLLKKQIKAAQSFLIKQDTHILISWIGLFTSLIFFAAIQAESIFYFSAKIKTIIILLFFVSLFIIFLFWSFQFYRALHNKVERYQFETLSKKLGFLIYPSKPDKILNALQLESGLKINESNQLAKIFINEIVNKIDSLNIKNIFIQHKTHSIKKYILMVWVLMILFFSLKYNNASNAFYRLKNPLTQFSAPKPFILSSQTGNVHILGGEKIKIEISSSVVFPDTINLRLIPRQVSTKKRDSLNLNFSAMPDEKGIYTFLLPELFQDYSYQANLKAKYFWESWEIVQSEIDTIFVTDRPSLEKFSITVVPPAYSKLPNQIQEGNNAVIQGLKGSIVQMELSSNRILKSAYLLMEGKKVDLSFKNKEASGYYMIDNANKFSINLVDRRGITNRDPITYNTELIPDYAPVLIVMEPSPILELGDDQSIPIQLNIQDDFGFSNLQVAYEVRKPSFLNSDPYVAMFNLPGLKTDSLTQKINHLWDLGDLFLMPDDEVHFHFELTDNDIISGPKKTISSLFMAKVPSLETLYQKAEIAENEFIENISSEVEEVEELKKQFEMLEMKALKAEELDWEQQKSVKNSLEKAKEELENLEKISDSIEEITEQAEKHNLFSSDLLKKFEELSSLINSIMPKDMLKNMSDLEEALDNMDMDSIKESLNNLTENMDQIQKDLERYLEIFKQLQIEQKFDELRKRMEQLFKQQELLNNELTQKSIENDTSNLERLIAEEQRNLDEFKNIKSLLEEASDLVKPFNENTSEELSSLSQSDLTEEIERSLSDTKENISNQELDNAQKSSEESLSNMKEMMKRMSEVQQDYQEQSISEISKKFEKIIQDLLYLSSQEEYLRQNLNNIPKNSPRVKELAAYQQLLQDQLQSVTRKIIELSKETFSITPEIGRGLGKANANMDSAKKKLAERNLREAYEIQNLAMAGLNETALALFNSMTEMQQSGSASGFQQLLEQMQKMTGQQKGLNQQGMQLGLGQMAASAQQEMMQQMLSKQMSVRKSLDQLMKEMNSSGGNKLGNLNGIADEMDKVIKDLEKNKFERQTQKRQQKILSRMLDSQTSMTQRGQKEERKSFSSKGDILFTGAGGLPVDMGQREDLALKALNNAVNAGYSKKYQDMIKRYFNSLTNSKSDLEDDQ